MCSGGKARSEIRAWNVAIEMQRSPREGQGKKSQFSGECLREMLGIAPSGENTPHPPNIYLNYTSLLGFTEAGESITARPKRRLVPEYRLTSNL